MSAARNAIALYAIAARDPIDFLEMIAEPDLELEVLTLLREMLASPGGPNTDRELNALLLGPVEQQLHRRGVAP